MPRVFVSEATRQWAHNLDDLRDRWKIQREIANEREWMPVDKFAPALMELEDDALLLIRARVFEIKSEIEAPLKKAKARAVRYHDYLDPEQFWEMEAAAKAARLHMLVVESELQRRGKVSRGILESPKAKRRRLRGQQFGQHFADVAKERLPADVWEEMKQEALTRVLLAVTAND